VDSVKRAVRADDGATVIEPLHVPHGMRARMRGLLGRDGLAEGEGMWFPHCRSVHTFGMRFAIDLVYLDRRFRVCKIVSDLRPARVSACLSASSVIELSSGGAHKLGLSLGTRLDIVD
jgi:hypothetical protein